MKRFSFLLFCVVIVFCLQSAVAQTIPDLEKMTGIMKRLRDGYDKAPLSFDMKYIYANEHTPGKILDSLNGWVETDGTNYHSLMDNTETIHNDKYNIVLFREDKIMYLAGATSASMPVDPLLMMDSILTQSGATSCTISKAGKNTVIRIGFKEGGSCKRMEMTIDTVAHRMLSMEYVVKTSLLTETPDANDKAAAEGYDEYAIVRSTFYNYRPLKPDASRFDDKTFFYKEGTEFRTKEAYSEYKIFVATPNL
ncbi:hypothetical protein SAMN05428988_5225 [Chitinophaga sp. YR573]|uniref:hypothetical protein n=1 Tax=Chitinophaga sp. YR573 TaxID=1881040 RepID=UPI0008D81941|nr:hypothetical protein [Chitinophaga sp. YR573]SEW40110.1 hypothetical protein SAMN05428988_5225 [Chitinophaga sp. YR573]